MDASQLTESLRYGSHRTYNGADLGKFGFGLKTASTSQCRRVVVASRRSPERARIEARALDLNHIEDTDRWEILVVGPADRPDRLVTPLKANPGTVVLWEDLDRVLDYKDPFGGWARRRLLEHAEATALHLGMVFHRFLTGRVRGRRKVRMFVNDSAVEPWDPFCTDEDATTSLPPQDFPVASDHGTGIVRVSPYVLPDKNDFSDAATWARASGPMKWNRQQGLYIYRADRLIQWGGWSRVRTIDEHTKLARVAVDFPPVLDSAFGINISKAIVRLPASLREQMEPTVSAVSRIAQQRYRKSSERSEPRKSAASRSAGSQPPSDLPGEGTDSSAPDSRLPGEADGTAPRSRTDEASPASALSNGANKEAGSAIENAARSAGESEALGRIASALRRSAPEVAHDLGW